MKRFYSLLLFASLTLLATAQAGGPKRLVLIEEFTNTGCGPCASWSPVLDSCINYRLGDCIAIKYHSSYPDREDEFYLAEPEANQARIDFYQALAYPTTLIDGQELDTRTFGHLDQSISYCLEQPAKCSISIDKTITDAKLAVKVGVSPNMKIEEIQTIRLFICVVEKHIVAEQPYSNGEKELYYTMRKMLTPTNGTTVYDTFGPGHITRSELVEDGTVVSASWDATTLDDLNQLGVVAFVQDMDTKEIWNAAYSGPAAEGENQLTLQTLQGTPDLICTPDYYGRVVIRNDGANAITEATLNVSVNGTVKQYPWTGHLDYLERDTLVFDGFTTFQLADGGKNAVEMWFSGINGTDAVSNTRTSSFNSSVQASYGVQLKLYTDKKPEETTWKLYDGSGTVVQQGGPYDGQARKFITVDFDLRHDDCYTLEFLDAGGDGISSATYGKGYYQLLQKSETGKTTRIAQGDYSGSVFDLQFRLDGTPAPPHRLVLFEEFTNTSCDPCADFSPSLDEALYRRMGDVVAVTYHYNFPSPQDPFYLASADDVMARASFYGVTGVPALRVNGVPVSSWGYEEYLDSYIDGAGQEPEKVSVEAAASLSGDVLKVDVSLTPLATASSSLRLFVAAVEERVEWEKPAANGERSWNYVLRKQLAGAEGQAIDLSSTKATPTEYSFSWQVENLTDASELGIVTFVQDTDTHEILGTCYTPRPTGSASAAKILKVLNTPERICSPIFNSDLMVRNTGRETLTKATLCVSINGAVQRTPWAGSLGYLEIDTLHTPAFTDFTLATDSDNDVEIWLADLNGTEEESIHKTFALANAYHAENAVRLTIMTDNAPAEITWQVLGSAGQVVCEGGPYAEARKKQVVELPLYADDCYTLLLKDSGGNGINGDNGRGYFMLHEVSAGGKARLLVQDTYTTATHTEQFSLDNAARMKGDVNGDGTADVADIATVISVMAGGTSSSLAATADVNGDGTVDVADIAEIITIMAAK